MATTKTAARRKSAAKSTTTNQAAPRQRDDTPAHTITTPPPKPKKKRTNTPPAGQLFWQRQFTIESLYWVLLGMIVIAMALWIATLQIRVNSLYDQLNTTQAATDSNASRRQQTNRPPVVTP